MPYITARHDSPSSAATLKQSKIGENGYNTEIEIIDVHWSGYQKRKKYK